MSILANIYKNLFALKSHHHSSSAVINNDGTTAQEVHDRLWLNFVNHTFAVSPSATQEQLDNFNNKHITAAERVNWNAKADTETYSSNGENYAADLPGGLQLRWGKFSSNNGTVTFASPFTHGCQSVTTNSDMPGTTPHTVTSVSATGCEIVAIGEGPYRGFYFAIGR